jgi:hypothetical protein
MFSLLLFLSLSSWAASDSLNAFEKTHPRDNTFCTTSGGRIEFIIRGLSKYTEPKEKGFGEFLFYRNLNKTPKLLPFNQLREDTYSFFKGQGSLCSKTLGFEINPTTAAVLLLKENRPFLDKLAIQLFDSKSLAPKVFITTDYPVEKVIKSANGFVFKTSPENYNPEIGKVTIDGHSFIFQEKSFPHWINYSDKGFEVSETTTYKKFPWKKAFKDEAEFMSSAGWASGEKTFSHTVLYFAINHQQKKQCLLLLAKKQKLQGSELWRCYAL